MFFTKIQHNGNDFIFIDIDSLDHRYDFSENLIVRLCNRNFGIGADGLILITRNGCDNLKIDIYNSDGSKANICGNALISLGEYLYTNKMCVFKCGLKNKENVICNVTVKTDSGEKTIFFNMAENFLSSVTVNMGRVDIVPLKITDEYDFIFKQNNINVKYISIGNLHGVIIVDKLKIENEESKEVKKIKNLIKQSKIQNHINVEIIQIVNKNKIRMLVFERGVGETLSCGSGASAAVAVAVKKGYCVQGEEVKVQSRGGNIKVKYENSGDVLITGKAKIAFTGDFYL